MENQEDDKPTLDSKFEPDSSEVILPGSIMSFKKLLYSTIVTVALAFVILQIFPIGKDFIFHYARSANENAEGISLSSEMYSVVFDAGSTGSRVFVYHFKCEEDHQTYIVKLSKETFMWIEPGLSSYAYDPLKAPDSLKPLLLKAQQNVPSKFYPTTLLLFKATAGLRLLSKTKGDQIMKEVKNFFIKSSPFYLPDPEKVEVMGGSEEGLFGWITVNFLIESLWDGKPNNTAAVIDLGGGSLQITFEIPANKSENQLCEERVGEVYHLNLINSHFKAHTHSFLGYGLKSAYLQIMGGTEDMLGLSNKKEMKLSSPCFVPDFESTWHHGGVDYVITGQESDKSRLESCKSHVDAFVKKAGFVPSSHLAQQEMHLFSYFINIAWWAGIVPKDIHQALLTPADFYASAQHHCKSTEFSLKKPFQCINLLYVYSILTQGLQLPPTKTLHVEDQIGEHEVSWALGSALSSLPKVCSYKELCSRS